MEELMDYINTNNRHNITVLGSTANSYLDALKAEDIAWPTQYHDILPYQSWEDFYWDGLYTTRPASKRFVKTASADFHMMSGRFAERMINTQSSDKSVREALKSYNDMNEDVAMWTHHDAVTGNNYQYVDNDYRNRTRKVLRDGFKHYNKDLTE